MHSDDDPQFDTDRGGRTVKFEILLKNEKNNEQFSLDRSVYESNEKIERNRWKFSFNLSCRRRSSFQFGKRKTPKMLVLNTARKLLFSNLSYRTSEQNLIDYFSKFGSIEEISLFKDDQEQSLRRGFVTFYDRTSTDCVMEKRPHQIDGRIIEIHREIPAQFVNAKNISESLGIHLIVNEIFINRVSEYETRQMFVDYFQSFGQIVDCRIYKGSANNGKSTGYGFVRFADYDSVGKIWILICFYRFTGIG